jgi:hypothetical protein
MRWYKSTTDKEWDASHRIAEQLRHERLAREASIICPIETTPLGDPAPPISMARHRQAQLDQQAKQLRDIWTDDREEKLII